MPFFTILEEDRDVADMILDYSISQTTLEEVFLNVGQVSIATHAEKQHCVRCLLLTNVTAIL